MHADGTNGHRTSGDGSGRRAFGRYWAAVATGSAGGAITGVALPVLVVTVLHASPIEVGLISAVQVLPYAVFGIGAGVLVDRVRRHPLLVWATAVRALCLAVIPVLWVCGVLTVPLLAAALFAYGSASVFAFAATQSLLPSLVPRSDLVRANARLDQTDAAAQTAGPVAGGALVAAVGAPGAFVASAAALVMETLLLLRVRVAEATRARAHGPVRADVVAGLRWTYRHATLGPLALSTHVWFVANAAAFTALSLLALRTLDIGPVWFGAITAIGGVGMLLGASAATALGRRFGAGDVVIATRVLYPIGWAVVLVVALLDPGTVAAVIVLAAALAITGFAAGAENANEMGYWQQTTPDELLGRTNATRRAGNRTCAAVGAALAGVTIALFGIVPTLAGVTVVFVVAALIVALSPLRGARADDA